jgi:hypothetical protein
MDEFLGTPDLEHGLQLMFPLVGVSFGWWWILENYQMAVKTKIEITMVSRKTFWDSDRRVVPYSDRISHRNLWPFTRRWPLGKFLVGERGFQAAV